MNDRELIQWANKGDPDAFEGLYYRYRDWVYRLAWRFTGHQQDALDVLQETFIYLLSKFPGFELTASMTTFLYPVVKHISMTIRAKRSRFTSDEELLLELATSSTEGQTDRDRSELAVALTILPGERSGHDISLAVDIDAGVAIERVNCPSHAITKSAAMSKKLTVKLSNLDNIPNKDFVLRYKVAGKTVKSALVTHRDKQGGFFTLMLYPPENLSYLKRAPMEMIFVLDCSGSMSGKPIAKAKQAITRALKKLQPDDTFQVIRFSNSASQFGPNPVPATADNVRRVIDYVKNLHGSGGTMMIEGIKAALDFAHDPKRFRLVSFMTDGYIGNEAEILAVVHEHLGASRIFSFGVGSSVNRYLLDRMAKLGKGAVAYVGLDDSASEVVDLFYDRISHPAQADVTVDWGDMDVTDVFPSWIPDLFVGRPIILTGRFKGRGNTTIHVTGSIGDLSQEIAIPVNLDDSSQQVFDELLCFCEAELIRVACEFRGG